MLHDDLWQTITLFQQLNCFMVVSASFSLLRFFYESSSMNLLPLLSFPICNPTLKMEKFPFSCLPKIFSLLLEIVFLKCLFLPEVHSFLLSSCMIYIVAYRWTVYLYFNFLHLSLLWTLWTKDVCKKIIKRIWASIHIFIIVTGWLLTHSLPNSVLFIA